MAQWLLLFTFKHKVYKYKRTITSWLLRHKTHLQGFLCMLHSFKAQSLVAANLKFSIYLYDPINQTSTEYLGYKGAVSMVKWLAWMTHDREVLVSVPVTSAVDFSSRSCHYKLFSAQVLRTRNDN